jgi:hypothetical protein
VVGCGAILVRGEEGFQGLLYVHMYSVDILALRTGAGSVVIGWWGGDARLSRECEGAIWMVGERCCTQAKVLVD